jgi:hypothetical protein
VTKKKTFYKTVTRWTASWVTDGDRVYKADSDGGFWPLERTCRLAASQANFMSESVGVPRRSVIWNQTFKKLLHE